MNWARLAAFFTAYTAGFVVGYLNSPIWALLVIVFFASMVFTTIWDAGKR